MYRGQRVTVTNAGSTYCGAVGVIRAIKKSCLPAEVVLDEGTVTSRGALPAHLRIVPFELSELTLESQH